MADETVPTDKLQPMETQEEPFKLNVVHERYIFNKRSRRSTETVRGYIVALSVLAESCEFGELKQGLIRDRLVSDENDPQIRKRLLSDPGLTLESAIIICSRKKIWYSKYHTAAYIVTPDRQFHAGLKRKYIRVTQPTKAPDKRSTEQAVQNKVTTEQPSVQDAQNSGSMLDASIQGDDNDNANDVVPDSAQDIADDSPINKVSAPDHPSRMVTEVIVRKPKGHELGFHHASNRLHSKEIVQAVEQQRSNGVIVGEIVNIQLGGKIFAAVVKGHTFITSGKKPENEQANVNVDDDTHENMEDNVEDNVEDNGDADDQNRPPATIIAEIDKINKSYRCHTCNKWFSNEATIESHLRNIHAGKQVDFVPYRGEFEHGCDTCGRRYEDISTFNKHIKCHLEPSSKCDLCGKVYKKLNSLKVHIRNTHQEKDPTKPNQRSGPCTICNKTFCDKFRLKRHMMCHSGDRPFACTLCDKRFLDNSKLKYHMATTHSDARPHKCCECGKTFALKQILKAHLRVVHNHLKVTNTKDDTPAEFVPYICDICGKSFKSSVYLRSHEVVHSEKRDFFCEICGWQGKRHMNLKSHMQHMHSDRGGPVNCDICGKQLADADAVRHHKSKIHNPNRRAYDCTICGRKLSSPEKLSYHVKTHSKSKQNVCNTCGRVFRRAHNLNSHIEKVHHGWEVQENMFY